MPKYTVTIDTDSAPDNEAGLQEAAVGYSLDKGTPFTAEEFLQRVVQLQVDSLGNNCAESKAKVIFVKFVRADAQTRSAAESALAAVSVAADPVNP